MTVELRFGGQLWTGFTSATIKRSVNSLCGSFSLSLGEEGAALIAPPGTPCTVSDDGEVLITGYVDGMETDTDGDSASVSVTGRSAPADIVDSQLDARKVWASQRAIDIIRDIAALHSLTVSVDSAAVAASVQAMPRIVGRPGDQLTEILERVCRTARLILTDDNDGNLRVYLSGSIRSSVNLELGQNLIRSSCGFDGSQLASRYVVRGQTGQLGADDVETWGVQGAEYADDLGLRSRVQVITPPQGMRRADAKRYAEWYAATQAARAVTATGSVVGWRESGFTGALWQPGALVRYVDSFAGLDAEMVIQSVEYRLDDGGQVSTLTCQPQTGFEPQRTKRTNPTAGSKRWADVEKYAASIPPREVSSD